MKPTKRLVTVAMLKKFDACEGGIAQFRAINGGDKMWITVAAATALCHSLPFSFLGNMLSPARRRKVKKKLPQIYTTTSEHAAALTLEHTDWRRQYVTGTLNVYPTGNLGVLMDVAREITEVSGRYRMRLAEIYKERDQQIAALYATEYIAATPRK